MSGIKYVLRNNTTSVQFFDYKTLSDAMWNYQVQLNPGQTKTIWAETGSLKIYNNGAITIEEQSVFPPPHVIGTGGTGSKTYVDYDNQTVLIVAKLFGTNNIGYSILDFDNNVIVGPVDLGLNTLDGWSDNDVYPLTKSGYAMYFQNSCDSAAIYLDYKGTILGQYTADTGCNYNYNVLSGKFSYFIDYNNGVLVYSDGKKFNTLEYDTNYDFDVEYSYDGCNKDGFIIYSGYNNSYTWNIVTMDSITPIYSWNYADGSPTLFEYENSNFFTIFYYDYNASSYTFLKIYSSKGILLKNIFLNENYNYINYDTTFFGENKMNIILYNSGDNSVPYLIYTYDGNTNLLISTTHDNDGNYTNWGQKYITLNGGDNNYPSQDCHIIFYQITSTDDWFYLTDYCDILSYFSGDTSYRLPYVINNNDDKTGNWVTMYDYFLGSTFILFYHDNEDYLKLLVTTSEDTTLKIVQPLNILSNYYFYTWLVGDNFIFQTFTNFYSDGTIYVYDAIGNQLDYKIFYDFTDIYYAYNTLYIGTEPGHYYFNTKNLKFESLEYNYDDNYTSNYFYTNTYKLPSTILLTRSESNTPYVRVLTSNNLTPEVILPTHNGYNFRVGKDVILYVYYNDDGKVVINLYNNSLALLRSTVTNFMNWDFTEMIENRAYIRINEGGSLNYYMVSANGIKMVKMSNNWGDYNMPNDYYWWD